MSDLKANIYVGDIKKRKGVKTLTLSVRVVCEFGKQVCVKPEHNDFLIVPCLKLC